MIDRLSIRRGPTPASCGYVLHPPTVPRPRAPTVPAFKYTHYTFIRALNTSRIDGIERYTRGIYAYFPLILFHVLPSSAPLLIFYSALLFLPFVSTSLSLSHPAKPTGRLANEAPLHWFCVGRAMLDWCRCVCKRAGQHQCFESSVRPHYFTPGLGTAIPSTSCSLYNLRTARHLPFLLLSSASSLSRSPPLARSRARIPMHTTDTY